MNTTQKTIATVATAATLIGGGVALYETSNTTTSKPLEVVETTATATVAPIDWFQYDLNVPQLVVPTLDIPELTIPSYNTNIVASDNTNIELIKLDSLIEDINSDFVKVNNLTEGLITIPSVDEKIIGLDNPSKDFNDLYNFALENKNKFIDKRMVLNDKQMYFPNDFVKAWKKIYNQYEDMSPFKYVPIKNKFRMITEVRTPMNASELNILTENLAYYKSEGYDSVLYGFTKDDNPTDVLNTIKYIVKYCNMKVWLTYTGKESLNETVFMNPDVYEKILSVSAPYISGYVNSWRRTSVHLWKQDNAFMNYTNSILRKVNPRLPIIGEIYYGNNYKY